MPSPEKSLFRRLSHDPRVLVPVSVLAVGGALWGAIDFRDSQYGGWTPRATAGQLESAARYGGVMLAIGEQCPAEEVYGRQDVPPMRVDGAVSGYDDGNRSIAIDPIEYAYKVPVTHADGTTKTVEVYCGPAVTDGSVQLAGFAGQLALVAFNSGATLTETR